MFFYFPPAENKPDGVFPTFSTQAGHSPHPLALLCSPQPWQWASAPAFARFLLLLYLSFWLGGCHPIDPVRGGGHGCCHSEVFPQPPALPRASYPVASPGLPPLSKAVRVASKLGEDKPWLSHRVPEPSTGIPTLPGVRNRHPPPTQGHHWWAAKG